MSGPPPETVLRTGAPKAVRKAGAARFASPEVHRRFLRLVEESQQHFLSGRNEQALQAAGRALRIHPTAHLFALLAVISESQGHFERACDFRLLQAFLANDVVLWEELLHEFLHEKQMYYRACTCLQRLSAMEVKDKQRYRMLQLQLVDLYIGLGEIKRATSILIPLWNSSRCRDFEVFAMLSSLFFQLGRWNALERLITTSLQGTFRIGSQRGTAEPGATTATGDLPATTNPTGRRPRTVSKRVRFFGGSDGEETAMDGQTVGSGAEERVPLPPSSDLDAVFLSQDVTQDAGEDEFDFSSPPRRAPPTTTAAGASGHQAGSVGDNSAAGQYQAIEITSATAKKNFLTLINVHAELLNEKGQFYQTLELMNTASGVLGVPLLSLPPDLLVRLGIAYAYLDGGEYQQSCSEVFRHLVETCSLDEYGDVLYDGAQAMLRVGLHADALYVFQALRRWHEMSLANVLQEEKVQAENRRQRSARISSQATHRLLHRAAEDPLSGEDHLGDLTAAAEAELAAIEQEAAVAAAQIRECKAVLSAATLGVGQCEAALENISSACEAFRRVLELDVTNVPARIAYGKLLFFKLRDSKAAVEVLIPRDEDDAFQKILLGAELVEVFAETKQYVEAIAVGVSMFERMVLGDEEGDTQSVAPGSTSGGRRLGGGGALGGNFMPTMSRASSAIVPATAVADAIARSQGVMPSLGGSAASVGGGAMSTFTTALAGASQSIAASFRATASPASVVSWARRSGPLTYSTHGESAAASMAGGVGDGRGEAVGKDASAIFRFNRRRRTGLLTAAAVAGGKAGRQEGGKSGVNGPLPDVPAAASVDHQSADGLEETAGAKARKRRREEAVQRSPEEYWNNGGSIGNVHDLAEMERDLTEMEEQLRDSGTPREGEETGDAGEPTRDASGFLIPPKRPLPPLRPSAGDATRRDPEREASGSVSSTSVVAKEEEEEVEEEEVVVVGAYNLPSLEEISSRFADPVMAQLFLSASSHDSEGPAPVASGGASALRPKSRDGVDGGEGLSEGGRSWVLGRHPKGAEPGGAPPAAIPPPTSREVIQMLGLRRFVGLAVTIVSCYIALGKYTEAKEFATIVLAMGARRTMFRHAGAALDRPLRLCVIRAALLASGYEDACRVALQLLRQDTTELEREEVLMLLARVVNDGGESGWGTLSRTLQDRMLTDVPVLVLLANRYYNRRSYIHALNLYLVALEQRPSDVFLLFHVGLCYLLTSYRKHTVASEECLHAALYYLQRYEQTVTMLRASREGEATYNVARAFHFLGLAYLAIPLYEKVIHRLRAPEQCTAEVQLAARVNLYLIYKEQRNMEVLEGLLGPPSDLTDGRHDVYASWVLDDATPIGNPVPVAAAAVRTRRLGDSCNMSLALDALRGVP